MEQVSVVGLDLAKSILQVHGVNASGEAVLRRRLTRGQLLKLFEKLPSCIVGMEACASAHYWEMSENVLIEDCTFDQGDDAISVKSGRDMDAWRLAAPCRNVVVRNCTILNGHQLLAIGSELSAGIENVWLDNCHFTGDGKGADGWAVPIANLLFVKTNERRGGFVRNIHMSRVSATTIEGSVLGVETDVLYQWRTLLPTYERRLTPIEGLHVNDIIVQQAGHVCRILGEAEQPVREVRLARVSVAKVTGEPAVLQNVTGYSAAG